MTTLMKFTMLVGVFLTLISAAICRFPPIPSGAYPQKRLAHSASEAMVARRTDRAIGDLFAKDFCSNQRESDMCELCQAQVGDPQTYKFCCTNKHGVLDWCQAIIRLEMKSMMQW